ncbi:MAG: sugar phosphate isomerase/epimerase [Pirellulales bacterium]|nr:sugar phosphate isomerase/epimerase [Pirellulales bacterium]
MTYQNSRRLFLQTAAASAATVSLAAHPLANRVPPGAELKGQRFKTLKIGMVGEGSTLTAKFKAAKAAGFAAIELNAPGINTDEVKRAIDESGLPVDGSVCGCHWQIRHTDKDPEVRAKALEELTNALIQTEAVGGKTVLLVVGHGNDGPEEEIWERSVENISKALPLAGQLGVSIAIENVWNQFCYDHGGDSNQTADKYVKYVDEFNSPLVGMQFDIGNHWKYGSMGDWIRQLGKRIIKLDVKGFSRENNRFTKIGEGDLDFAAVCDSLSEINFHGWCAAEVGGGNMERLVEISKNMDRAFNLS